MGSGNCIRSHWIASPSRGAIGWLLVLAAVVVALGSGRAMAVHPDSPEVRKLIDDGLAAIATPEYDAADRYASQLGGKCVIALAFVKAVQRNHPRVTDAVTACRAAMNDGTKIDVYSNGLAIVFLCELGATRYH